MPGRYVVKVVGAPRSDEIAFESDEEKRAIEYWEAERRVKGKPRVLLVEDRLTGKEIKPPLGPAPRKLGTDDQDK